MVTSFADGTKVSFEQALVANATGMTVAKRGMVGQDHHGHVDELTTKYDVAELEAWRGGGLRGRLQARPRRLRPGHPRRPEAAPLPQPLQARARVRSTASTRRTTCATSRCRRRSPEPCCSLTRPSRRWGRRRSRSSPTAKRDLDGRRRRWTASAATTRTAWPSGPSDRGRDAAADGRGRGLRPHARCRQGRGADLRRRGAAGRSAGGSTPQEQQAAELPARQFAEV